MTTLGPDADPKSFYDDDVLATSARVTAKGISLAELQGRMQQDGEANMKATYGNLAVYSICAAVGGVTAAATLGAGAIVIPVCASLFGGYSIVTFLNGEPQLKASRSVLATDVGSRAIASWDEVNMIRDKAAAYALANGTTQCDTASEVVVIKKKRDAAATEPKGG